MSNINNSEIRVIIHENDEEEFIDQVYFNISRPRFVRNSAVYNQNLLGDIVYFNDRNIANDIRYAFDRVSMLDVMAGLFDNMMEDTVSEEKMMEIAQRESLNHYKTQEKKPHIKLDINEGTATEKLKNEKCTICVTDFEVGDKITELECKHVLHTNCIAEWVKYKSECPICRHPVKTIDESIKSEDSDCLDEY